MPPKLTSKQLNLAINLYAKQTGIASTMVRSHSQLRSKAIEYYFDLQAKKGTKPGRIICKK